MWYVMRTTSIAIAFGALMLLAVMPMNTASAGISAPYGDCKVSDLLICAADSTYNCPSNPPQQPDRSGGMYGRTQTPASVLIGSQNIPTINNWNYDEFPGMVIHMFTVMSTCGHAATVCTVPPAGYETAQGGYCMGVTRSWFQQGSPDSFWFQAPTSTYCHAYYNDCVPSEAVTVRLDANLETPLPAVLVVAGNLNQYYYSCGCGNAAP